MGADKALLRIGGESLVERVVRRLRPVCAEVIVASGDGVRLAGVGDREVADAVAGAGPLAGIVAGLGAARTDLVAVAAVDMPWVSTPVFALLAHRWNGEPAVVPRAGGRLQPLHGIYARSCATEADRLLRAGHRSVRGLLAELGAAVVEPEDWHDADPSGRFADNLNSPADLARLR